jgi:hypothetical protein
MPGGIIQLAAFGAEDAYLMGNPQITFFKTVYKQHTNYAEESVDVSFDSLHNVSETSQQPFTLKATMPRVGDLISRVMLKVELPSILSSNIKKFKWVKNLAEVMVRSVRLLIGGQEIQRCTGEWIHIYHKMTIPEDKRRQYDMMIGNTPDLYNVECFQDLYQKWTRDSYSGSGVYQGRPTQFTSPESQELVDTFLDHFAHTLCYKRQEETDEDNIRQTVQEIKDSIPATLRETLTLFQHIQRYRESVYPYYDPNKKQSHYVPSIVGKTLYLPLPLYFSKHIGLSLPVVAFPSLPVEIEIEFNPITYWFTLLEWDAPTQQFYRRRPNPLRKDHKLSYFVYTENIGSHQEHHFPETRGSETSVDTNNGSSNISGCGGCGGENVQLLELDTPITDTRIQKDTLLREEAIQLRWNNNYHAIHLSLEVFYIFLDEKEQKQFANLEHTYLMEQQTLKTHEGYHGNRCELEMSLYNPVKELIWVLQRSDLEKYNIWFNYTNWIEPDQPIWSNTLGQNEYEKPIPETHPQSSRIHKNIMRQAKLLFNGMDRLDYKDETYMNYLQPFLHHTSSQEGIYMYSFSLSPEKFQPTGSVDMSMIQKCTLEFTTLEPPMDPEFLSQLAPSKGGETDYTGPKYDYVEDEDPYQYQYNLNMYVVNYNLLKIQGGQVSIAFQV